MVDKSAFSVYTILSHIFCPPKMHYNQGLPVLYALELKTKGHMGHVKQKSAFKHGQNLQIQVILYMC